MTRSFVALSALVLSALLLPDYASANSGTLGMAIPPSSTASPYTAPSTAVTAMPAPTAVPTSPTSADLGLAQGSTQFVDMQTTAVSVFRTGKSFTTYVASVNGLQQAVSQQVIVDCSTVLALYMSRQSAPLPDPNHLNTMTVCVACAYDAAVAQASALGFPAPKTTLDVSYATVLVSTAASNCSLACGQTVPLGSTPSENTLNY